MRLAHRLLGPIEAIENQFAKETIPDLTRYTQVLLSVVIHNL